MAFEIVERIEKGGRNGRPASASLLDGAGGGRPTLRVSFTKAFLETFDVGDGERFKLLLGSDDDKNRIRLVRDQETGVVAAHIGARGGASFNCGHFARFGDEAATKEFCDATIIDKDTVEIVLPPWEE